MGSPPTEAALQAMERKVGILPSVCWGEGPEAPSCPVPPRLRCVPLPVGADEPMQFCSRHFWRWNAASLERLGLVKLAGHLKDSVDAGVLDATAHPAEVRAYDLRMFL